MSVPTSTLSLFLSMVGGPASLNVQTPLGPFSNSNSPAIVTQQALTIGDNTIAIPTLTAVPIMGLIVVDNGGTCLAKGVGGDTGYNFTSNVNTIPSVWLFTVGGGTAAPIIHVSAPLRAIIFWI